MYRVALASSRAHIGDDDELPLTAAALDRLGLGVSCVPWDDPAVDWAGYDLVVIRSCWDYPARHADFLAWAREVPRLANPYQAIGWNTDKRYLHALAHHGIRVPPTVWEPVTAGQLGRHGDWVIKPTVSANGEDTYRVSTQQEIRRVVAHLHARGKQVMIQPYLWEIDAHGELSLVYIDGARSHAIRKPAGLRCGGRPGDFQQPAHPQRTDAAPELWAAGDRVLHVARRLASPRHELLYARIDLVPHPGNPPILMEAEITEPFLYLAATPHAADTFAEAILRRLDSRHMT